MAKGTVGSSMGGSLEYRYQLKPTTRNCKNCKYYKKRTDPVTGRWKPGVCSVFHMLITDVTNARLCSRFSNKNSYPKCTCKKKRAKKGKSVVG